MGGVPFRPHEGADERGVRLITRHGNRSECKCSIFFRPTYTDPKRPQGYLEVLKTWATSGIDGVQNLVKRVLARAAILGILIGQQLMQGENPQQSRGT
jgi:hypothetical protein